MIADLRILWADDQLEASRTFRKRVMPGHSVKFESSGEDALRRLEKEYFDIVLLDLAMPPGKWGGLWFLEELAKLDLRVPVIVISGEGTQTETIKALRLGAKDYVLKENLEKELPERIDVVVAEMTKERDANLLNEFPTPIALLYSRYMTSDRPTDKLGRLIEFVEVLLRFTVILGLSEIAHFQQSATVVKEAFSHYLFSPSLGTWNGARRDLAKQVSPGYFTKVNATIDNSFISRVIETRNDIHHGAMPSEISAQKLLNEHLQAVHRFLAEFEQRARLEVLAPQVLRFDGKGYDVESVALRGNNIVLPHQIVRCDNPVKSHHIYAVDLSLLQPRWVDLHPWIVMEPGAEPNSWHINLFDSVVRKEGKQTAFSGQESLRYIDVRTGHRDIVPGLTSNSLFKSSDSF